MNQESAQLLTAAQTLREELRPLRFAPPVAQVYQPLDYAWEPHSLYLKRFGGLGTGRWFLLGMNPGPFGMAQTGVPFGEIAAVRDWMKLEAPVGKPPVEHPKRPVTGFACKRAEVSGRRLYGWAKKRFGTAESFFQKAFVVNYCPLLFMEEGGKNRTPEQLAKAEREAVQTACDRHLQTILAVLKPSQLLGVGGFAATCLARNAPGARVVTLPHPSPANPAANKGWDQAAEQALLSAGLEW